MPKVFLSENKRLTEKFVAWVYGEMKVRKMSQRQMAAELDISQQALSVKLKTKSLSFEDFLAIIRVLEPDERELGRLIGRGD